MARGGAGVLVIVGRRRSGHHGVGAREGAGVMVREPEKELAS